MTRALVDELVALELEATGLLARSDELLDEARSSFRGSDAPVSVQLRSANSKLAPTRVEIAKSGRERFIPIGPFVASTYASIRATCPDSCGFKIKGCFAKAGATHLTMKGLDRAAQGMTALEVTLAEAAAIDAMCKRGVPQDGAKGGRDLRLHVGGEVSCSAGARALAGAARRWRERGGGRVWTFTHRWRTIPRAAWGDSISVLASCEKYEDLEHATRRGYAASIVVPEFPSGSRLFSMAGKPIRPCPAEATDGKVTCAQCRICLDDQRQLARGEVVGFHAHGADLEDAKAVLERVIFVPVGNLRRRA